VEARIWICAWEGDDRDECLVCEGVSVVHHFGKSWHIYSRSVYMYSQSKLQKYSLSTRDPSQFPRYQSAHNIPSRFSIMR
jgi:hypothetical protein